ncbi:hypothetical protein [Flavobacterium aquidurense]|uniref:Lipoprotein n=1 Tax=Flavobacterium aquidurense TaxID=362413 RepID=A0A0Q0WMV5_9FLAO|nr:hypothetical protein [Flavobacterium aquidurense]KQB37113.1 hypothetical protein RC62_2279 [Flavobacterium aquidurense]
MKNLILSLIVVTLISCNQAKVEKQRKIEVAIDLKSIAGKNIIEVESILGKPDKIEPFLESSTPCKNKPCQKGYYQKDKFEIIFINEKADWITINNLSEYDFDEENIEIFGLKKTEPEFKNPQDLIRWKNIEGINEISIFNDSFGKISYAYIKTSTE